MDLPNSSTAAEDRFHVVLESVLILIPTFPCSIAFSMQYCIFHAVLHFPCSIAFSMQYCSFGVGISDSTALSQAFAYLTY